MVENDFRTYDYHGIAQLRSYLPQDLKVRMNNVCEVDRKLLNNEVERWRVVTSKFEDGTILVSKHNQKRLDVRSQSFKSLRIYSNKASMVTGCLTEEEPKNITYQVIGGEAKISEINVRLYENGIDEIFCDLENYKRVSWRNPYSSSNLSEHQIALAHHIQRLMDKILGVSSDVAYSLSDHLVDIRLLHQNIN